MSTTQDLEIQKLKLLIEERDAAHRKEMRSKEEDLRRAKAEISQLQSSVYQSQVVQPSGPSNLDASTVHNEFPLSSIPATPATPATPSTPFHQDGMSRSNTVPRSNGIIHGYSRHEGAERSSVRLLSV